MTNSHDAPALTHLALLFLRRVCVCRGQQCPARFRPLEFAYSLVPMHVPPHRCIPSITKWGQGLIQGLQVVL